MKRKNFIQREVFVFKHFTRKGYALFACLGREVIVGVLSVATLTYAKADGVSVTPMPSDTVKTMNGRELTLGEVNVTATRAPLANGRVARLATVIDPTAIANAPSASVTDLMKLVPGVDVRQRGAIGAQADVSIRGGNYEQVAVLLDGINICDPQTGHNSFDFPVDPSQVERIEVLQGPAARVYGTSSLLGAINIVTLLPTHSSANATVEAGSYGYLRAAARANVATGHWNNSFGASYTRTDGFSRSSEGRLNADLDAFKALYRGQWADDGATIGWHAGISAKGYGANTFYSAAYDNQYERTLKATVALRADATCGRVRLRPVAYWNHNADRFELIRGSEAAVPYNYHRSDVYGLSLDAYVDWAAGRTAIGADMRSEQLVSTTLGEPLDTPEDIGGTSRQYTLGLDRTNFSLTLEHNATLWQRLTLSAGVVATRNTWNGTDFGLYPGADIALNLGRGWRLLASWNTSLRLPSATELYYSVGGHKADKHLKPEKLSAIELGASFDHGPVAARISAYYNHYRNMIDWVRRTDEGAEAPWQSVNFTKIDAYGLEASARANLQLLLPGQRWLRSAGVAYAYIDQHKAATPHIESRYALEYLRHKLVADLQLQPTERLNVGLNVRWHDRTGTFTDTSGQTQNYSPYATIDAKATWTEPHWRLHIAANNLTGTRYVDYGNVEQPGAWFTAGASFDLDW